MSLANQVLAVNDDLPIRTHKPVHSGKVRSVYWLTEKDSARLIKEKGYDVAPDAPLAIMVISDRISAFDCIWHGEGGLKGVPGKGAALNAISNHWFKLFKENGLADSHILDIPTRLSGLYKKPNQLRLKLSVVSTLRALCGVLMQMVNATSVVFSFQKVLKKIKCCQSY